MNPQLKVLLGSGPAPAGVDEEIAAAKAQLQEKAMAADDAIAAVSPVGKFSEKAMTRFVEALNKATNIFGVPAYREPVAGVEKIPTELTKRLLMVKAATDDAFKDEVLSHEYVIDPQLVIDDGSLRTVTAILNALPQQKEFIVWLKSAPKPEQEMEDESAVEAPETETEGDEAEAKFMKLISRR